MKKNKIKVVIHNLAVQVEEIRHCLLFQEVAIRDGLLIQVEGLGCRLLFQVMILRCPEGLLPMPIYKPNQHQGQILKVTILTLEYGSLVKG